MFLLDEWARYDPDNYSDETNRIVFGYIRTCIVPALNKAIDANILEASRVNAAYAKLGPGQPKGKRSRMPKRRIRGSKRGVKAMLDRTKAKFPNVLKDLAND